MKFLSPLLSRLKRLFTALHGFSLHPIRQRLQWLQPSSTQAAPSPVSSSSFQAMHRRASSKAKQAYSGVELNLNTGK